MKQPLFQIKAYLKHWFTSHSKRGDGVHSPFIFSFITDIKNEKHPYYAYKTIEQVRNNLLKDNSTIQVTDFGTGFSRERSVCDIEKRSAKSAKEAQLLFRMVRAYQPNTILDLGTCLGTSTLYLSMGNTNAQVYTFEGCPETAKIAAINFKNANAKNIQQRIGNLSETLPATLKHLNEVDFVFFDANHQKEATLSYFHQCLTKVSSHGIFVFDDIHWSEGMQEAWEIICQHPQVSVSIDLFHLGILFFNQELKPAHYKIKF
jgi:predicted O-methyltransferase YrrM